MSRPKYVFAHFMVGNTYPYTMEDWAADIDDALANHLDGFVLNVGKEDWQRSRVVDCFSAASASRLSSKRFHFFLSFDMSSIPSSNASDVRLLCDFLSAIGNHPRMLKIHDEGITKVVVSTFAGENSLFGQRDLDSAWIFVKRAMEESLAQPVCFIPAFFIDPARYSTLSSLDGAFNWNGSWPIHLTPSHSRSEIENPSLDADWSYLNNLDGKLFMAAVSPWFFTHYGAESWNKNWIYRSDDWLLVRRWEELIPLRSRIDIVQVISWNDYGESHYICPTVRGAQPNSQKWVDGFQHGGWARLCGYFARAFRDGVYPPIERDEIFVWARPHARQAKAAEDMVPRPQSWELTDDKCWVVILSTEPADVYMYSGETDVVIAEIDKGLSRLSRPLVVGQGMTVRLQRRGKFVAECDAKGFIFSDTPAMYNFNAFVASQ